MAPRAKPKPKAKGAPRKLGRPRLTAPPLADVIVDELVAFAENGAIDGMLADAAGVSRSTFAGWRKRKEPAFVAFFDRIERARVRGDIALLNAIRRAAFGAPGSEETAETRPDWKAARYILACRHADMSETRIAAREAAARAGDVEEAKIRAAVRVQAELDAAASDDATDETATTLPPAAQALAADLMRLLQDPAGAARLAAALDAIKR